MIVWFLRTRSSLRQSLQSKQAGNKPTLIRIETDAGHGAGKPTSKIIEEQTDIYGFTLYNMGYKELPQAVSDVKM